MGDFRLIVTGSREFSDHLALRVALDYFLNLMPPDTRLLIVHGGDPNPDFSSNADRIAQEWALEMKADGLLVGEEAHLADWDGPCRKACDHGPRAVWHGMSICQAAGAYRNEEMCASGGDWGLGALKVGTKSAGTKDCLRRMIRHRIRFELIFQGSPGRPRHMPPDLSEIARAASGAPGSRVSAPDGSPAGLRYNRVRRDG